MNLTLIQIENDAKELINSAKILLINKEAFWYGDFKHSKRLGKITDVMLNCEGKILVCLYIYRKGSKEFLNTKGWTRSYRRIQDLELCQND